MTEGDELLAAVYADPAADEPRRAYAAWLTARGDKLGEFIGLQLDRKAKGKRTQSKEKALLEAEGAGWWRDHPCRRFGAVRWEDTDRGFPARFRPGWPVSEGFLREQERDLVALAGNPGWSTVSEMFLTYDVVSPGVADLIRRGPLPLLRAIDCVNVAVLDGIADLPLPVRSLELWVREHRDLPVVTGLPALEELVLDMRSTVERAMQALRPSGLLERLRTLEIRGVMTGGFGDALGVFAALPSNVESFAINQFYGQVATATGDRARPDLDLGITAHQVDATIEELDRLPTDAAASIRVTFVQGGYFTKKNRPILADRVRKALERWGDQGTLIEG